MGKIRIKTVGEEEKPRSKDKHEKTKVAKAPGLKGGERVVAVGPTPEELEKQFSDSVVAKKASSKSKSTNGKQVTTETRKGTQIQKQKKTKFVKSKQKSKKYLANAASIKNNSLYPLDKGIELLKSFSRARFDETVELHINVKEKGISGQLHLPHGTGKKMVIKVADPSTGSGQVEELIANIEKGKIDFDILVAHPSAMSKLAKVAKILGPKGLMPNPKAGTITNNPEELIKKLSSGQITFKTESEVPLIHLSVGKLSFDEKKLRENIQVVVNTIGIQNIETVTLKSTMSPGIKLDTNSTK